MNCLISSAVHKGIMKNKRVECLVLILIILLFNCTYVNATSGGEFNESFQWSEYSSQTYLCDSSDVTSEPAFKDFVMEGVVFRITANTDGDGSAVDWKNEYGESNTACIGFMSGGETSTYDPSTTEKITITRQDGEPWTLNTIWADEKDCEDIKFTGILNGTTVVTKICDGRDQTLDFGNVGVDTLVISAKHFRMNYFTIDNLTGNTEATINKKPTASNFTATTIYQETAYAFETADFGYTDGDSDELDHIKIIEVPSDGTLWIDSDNDNNINGSEIVLGDDSIITKLQLDSAMLKYINVNGISTAFTFGVNDGKTYSDSSYTATLNVTPKPIVTLGVVSNSYIDENGGTATIKATLSNTYDKKTIVNLAFTGTASTSDYSVPSIIEIPSGQTFATVTITGTDDTVYEGEENIIIDIDSVTNGTEAGNQQVTCSITDDDTASLIIAQSDGSTLVNESGTTDTFTVVLATKPVSNVVLNITSVDTDEIDIDKATLTFTEDNWNLAQTVILTGIDDYLVDGEQTIPIDISVDDTQSDDKYNGLSESINVSVLDDDIAGFTIIKHDISLMVTEDGDTDSFKVKLDAQPETDVVINITSDDVTEKTISHSSLTFTKDMWNVEQEVIVTGVNDDSKDGERHTLITLSIDQANTDNAFDSVVNQNIAVTTIDNDVPNLVITNDNEISVREGVAGTEQIKIRLATQPTGGNDVNIILTPSDTSEISLSETAITILNADWNKEHNVSIQSVDDTELDSNITSSIDIDTTSIDLDYNGLTRVVKVTTIDNEYVEMYITANNNPVDNGSITTTVNNNTDFGNIDINAQTVAKTYTIQNTGNYDLIFTNTPYVTITGSSEFTIENQPINTISGGVNTTFAIKFDPSTIGEKIATVSIANNDIDKNPYTFTIKGTGTEDIDAPIITNFSPSNGESNIGIDSNLEITFNENITEGTGNISIFKHSDDTLVESISINDTVINGKVVTIIPVSNFVKGNKYYVQIDNNAFSDEIGNGYQGITDKTTWSFTTVRQSSTPSSEGNSSSHNNSSNTNISIKLNGKKQDSLGKIKTKYEDGKKVITVTINEKKLEEKLDKEAKGAKVSIPVNTKRGSVEGQLNGQMVKKMEEKEATVEIKTEKATYILPANQINIDKISNKLGEDVDLEDIDVKVKIGETSKDMINIVEETGKKDKFNIVASPVDFEVTCSYKNKEMNVSKFNAYVERLIALPTDIDPSKITTGIIMYPDGTTCHVPTQVIKVNEKYYAKINSLTNSTYTVVWNPKKYTDVENYWSKDTCNEMGARMIVEEENERVFNPDQQITRLFFTETVVKALGLGDKGVNANFTDIVNTDDGFGFVATSVEYELIKGYSNDTFRPNANITREEAATLIFRAMKLVGMKVDYTEEELQNEIDKFADKQDIYNYAKKPIAICSKNGLIVGNDKSQFLPKDNITKAELAIMIKRMLEKSGLIG